MEKKLQCVNVVSTGMTTGHLSRYELLKWINGLLGVGLKKVEDLCSGAVYCQLLNILFPGIVPLKKVKVTATQEHEYQFNLKLLQNALLMVGCDKSIPIDKLIKRRFQDNLEFLQWFKKFFDANYGVFDPSQFPQPVQNKSVSGSSASKQTGMAKKATQFAQAIEGGWFTKESERLSGEISVLEEEASDLQQQKDFFLEKLRAIEIFCQDSASPECDEPKELLVKKILEKMYQEDVDLAESTEEGATSS